MKTKEFFDLLEQHPSKEVIFQFSPNQFIPKAYHITEVKNAAIESVDCGGRPDSYFQTIVQLWHNGTEQSDRHMTAEKALKIFKIVDGVKPIKGEAPIFFEWGDAQTRTSHYEIEEVEQNEGQIIAKMFVAPTMCKPKFELEVLGKTASCC